LEALLGIGYFVLVVILTVVFFRSWYNSHIVISNSVDGEWQCYFSAAISSFLKAFVLTAIIMMVFTSFWPYLLVAAIIYGIYTVVKKHQ